MAKKKRKVTKNRARRYNSNRAYNAKGLGEKFIPYRPPKHRVVETEDDFYTSKEWRQLRYKILKKYGATCMLCNADRTDGVKIHVDHIKPRSLHPELELDDDNLQVLCEDCNLGKSNHDEIDWRLGN